MSQISLAAKNDILRAKLEQAYRLLLDADTVARKRGDKYGLCDEIDRKGNPYPSQWGADIRALALEWVILVDDIPVVKTKEEL